MPLLDPVLNPILGLLQWLLFPNSAMNTGKGVQSYVLSRVNPMSVTNTGASRQKFDLDQSTALAATNSNASLQVFALAAKASLRSASPPMNHAETTENYNMAVQMTHVPSPDKLSAFIGGYDMIIFSSLPVPSHWITQQHGFLGARNEFDYDSDYFEATFSEPGLYTIIISAPGFVETTWILEALYDPNPPPVEEEPVIEE